MPVLAKKITDGVRMLRHRRRRDSGARWGVESDGRHRHNQKITSHLEYVITNWSRCR